MLVRATFRSRFGGYYKVHTSKDGTPPAGLQPLKFQSQGSARQFLRNLQVPADQWLGFAASQDLSAHNDSAALELVSRYLLSGRIRVYRVEKADPLTNPPAKRVLRSTSGDAFYFEPASTLLTRKSGEIKRFYSAAGAKDFIKSINPNNAQLQGLVSNLNLGNAPQSGGTPSQQELVGQLAEALVKQELVVVVERPFSRTKDGTELELLEPAPLIRPSEIAPPPLKTWVEIKLVDDAGGPIANEPFVLICPKGIEHTGTTDGSGMARVDGIAQGMCRIAFTELDGSGISPA